MSRPALPLAGCAALCTAAGFFLAWAVVVEDALLSTGFVCLFVVSAFAAASSLEESSRWR